MPQSLILLKKLPYPDYLHDLQREGIYRASMSFLPGGCYAGAALFDASPSYSTPLSAKSTAADGCPEPSDTLGCLLWEVIDAANKVSGARPQTFNAFLFLALRSGMRQRWAGVAREVAAAAEGDGAYVAAGHLQGCGTYNAVAEVLADDHQQLLDLQLRLTDVEGVDEFSLGRVRADETRGWGEDAEEPV